MFSSLEQQTFFLDNYKGPIDFLLYLIRKKEIDVCNVPIRNLTKQYLQRLGTVTPPVVDVGAEFIGKTSSLLLFKSKKLLPDDEQQSTREEEEISDPNFEIIHHLLDYCRFKETAKVLACHEEQQLGTYSRGTDKTYSPDQALGIEHLTLEDLSAVFQKALEKASTLAKTVDEEEFRVSDKILAMKNALKQQNNIPIAFFLSPIMHRNELIVSFLALLELMKIGDIKIIKNIETNHVIIANNG